MFFWNEAKFLKAHSSINVINGVKMDPVSYVVQPQGQVAGVEEPTSPCIRWVDPRENILLDVVLQFLDSVRASIVEQIFGFMLG